MAVARFRLTLSAREARYFLRYSVKLRTPAQERFERVFARDILGDRRVFLAPSGRIAEYWILAAMGMKPGDEVITQGFNFPAVPAAIEAAGAIPIFADLRPDTFEIDPAQLEAKIGPRTRAVIVTHLYGNPAEMDPIIEVCERKRVPIIEDCAQAVGASYHGRNLGTLGLACYFTFGPTKNLTLLGGAAAATADPELGARIAELSQRHPRVSILQSIKLAAKAAGMSFVTSPLPFNLVTYPAIRTLSAGGGDPVHTVMAEKAEPLSGIEQTPLPSGPMAGVGLAQLERVEGLNAARARNGWALRERLKSVDGIVLPPSADGNVFLSFPLFHPRRLELSKELQHRGVDTDLGFMCDCSQLTMFSQSMGHNPHSDRAASQILHLPVHPYLRERDLDRIEAELREALRRVM